SVRAGLHGHHRAAGADAAVEAPAAAPGPRERLQALEPVPALDGAGTGRGRLRALARGAGGRAGGAARYARAPDRALHRADAEEGSIVEDRGGRHAAAAAAGWGGPGALRLRAQPPRDQRDLRGAEGRT